MFSFRGAASPSFGVVAGSRKGAAGSVLDSSQPCIQLAMPAMRPILRYRPRPNDSLQFQLIQERRGYAEPADDAIAVEVIIRAKLKSAAFLDLNMDDLLHEPVLREYDTQDWTDRLFRQLEHSKIEPRVECASAKRSSLLRTRGKSRGKAEA